MPDALATYRDPMRRRGNQARFEQKRHRDRARTAARHVAEYLRRIYEVDQIVLFGSVAKGKVPLDPQPDIDLLVTERARQGLKLQVPRPIDVRADCLPEAAGFVFADLFVFTDPPDRTAVPGE